MAKLTKTLSEIYEFIKDYKRRYSNSPTIYEIGQYMGFTYQTAANYLKRMKKADMISYSAGMHRCIILLKRKNVVLIDADLREDKK